MDRLSYDRQRIYQVLETSYQTLKKFINCNRSSVTKPVNSTIVNVTSKRRLFFNSFSKLRQTTQTSSRFTSGIKTVTFYRNYQTQ